MVVCLTLALVHASPAFAHSASRGAWIVGDFDGDHRPDLVTLSALEGSEPSLQSGSFATPALLQTRPLATQRLRARDLDGDFDRDLILEDYASVVIAVWINDGAGHFVRASLEDFEFQLSREIPAASRPAPKPTSVELTNDCPRCDLPEPVSAGAPQRAASGLAAVPEARFTNAVPDGNGARGPPLAC